ncbi:MAG: hypothetical protein H6713_24125 [Myxococcales bacterium]|nr:hypothetical protein [Myxococcales bacterium]
MLGAELASRPRLTVAVTARAISARAWKISALGSARIHELELEDARGPVPHASTRDGAALRVALARPPEGALAIRYAVEPEQGTPNPALPAGLQLRLDHARVLASAEETLLLPEDGPPVVEFALTWSRGAAAGLERVASTLGLPNARGPARLTALRHAAFLAGALGHAEFRATVGADDFAWSGEPSFDLRWSAAETAGARSAVDVYFGADLAKTPRFTALLAVDVDFAGAAGAQAFPRGDGLYVALNPGAPWDARVRLEVAQALVFRWIGGRLRLVDLADAPRERGAWFDAGFARAVAREVLVELGTLSATDYLEELHALLGERATSPSRAASLDELARRAGGGDAEALDMLAVRGALYATRLDAILRARGGSLQQLLQQLVEEARTQQRAELPLTALTTRVEQLAGPAEVTAFRRAILEGDALELPADALGPCFTPTRRTYTRFVLGFDATGSWATTPPTIVGLQPDGPAARAGLREGERLLSITADPDAPREPAEITVERDGQSATVRYRPAGPTVRAQGWKRRPGADPQQCPP